MALDEKVQVKVLVVTLERRFNLFGNLQQADVARQFHDRPNGEVFVYYVDRFVGFRVLAGNQTSDEVGVRRKSAYLRSRALNSILPAILNFGKLTCV